jgi:hypothetical protein
MYNCDTNLFTKLHRYPKISATKQMRPAIFADHFEAFSQQRWTYYLVKWNHKKEISMKAETRRQRQSFYKYTKKKMPH